MATIYIRRGTLNGDGTAPNLPSTAGGAGALNTPPALSANNTYRFWGYDTWPQVRPISITSAAATPLTIESYNREDGGFDAGGARALFDGVGLGNGNSVVWSDQSVNVLIRNLRATNCTGAGASGIRIRKGSGVVVRGCQSWGNTHGIGVFSTSSVAPGVITTDITIDGNDASGNSGSGIYYTYGDASGENIKRLTITNNKVARNGFGAGADRRGGIMHQCARSDGAGNSDSHTSIYGVFDLVIEGNELVENYSYALAAYCVFNEARRSSISRNVFKDSCGYGGLLDAHQLWLGGSGGTGASGQGVLVEENEFDGGRGFENGSIGSCCAILLDLNSNGSAVQPTGGGHIVRRNKIRRGWKGPSKAAISGDGILIISNTNCLVEGNFVFGYMNGLGNSGTNADSNVFQFNTAQFIGQGVNNVNANNIGMGFLITSGANVVVRNNVFTNCRTGIHSDTSGPTGFSETKNVVFGCTNARTVGSVTVPTGGTLDASDITTDPALYYGRPQASSPHIGLGTFTGTYLIDCDNVQRRNPPTPGAFEYDAPRTARY